MDDIERARIARAKDNKDVSAVQMLELALEDVRNGRVKADSVLIICIGYNTDGTCTHERYRANLTREAEFVAHSLGAARVMEDWTR